MTLLLERPDARVWHADHETLAHICALTPNRPDLLCVDAPYSERTHGAYREMPELRRSDISYAFWTPADVERFVELWAPLTRGWFLTLTDHVLAPVWERALLAADRYVFAPIPCVERGSRVRVSGDGPSKWSVDLVAARPREKLWLEGWRYRRKERGLGTSLPGAYVAPPGFARPRTGSLPGGKALWLMERLTEDYSDPGALVVDPCCGAGTTLHAAVRTGRRALGGDVLLEHAQLAADRLGQPVQQPLFGGAA